VDARSSAAAWLRGQVSAIEAKAERAAREQVSAARRDAVEKVSREADERIAREREKAKRELAEGDPEGEVARYRELRGRIGSAREMATRAESPAEGVEPETEEQPAVDQGRTDEKRAKRRAEKERRRAERARARAERKRAAQERRARRAERKEVPPEEAKPDAPMVDVNEATFEELRQLGLSVTQATRVVAYRQRRDGFDSVDDLDTIPGLPKSFLDEVKQRLSA
jgi:DNA uptake protein ComE-like DNA-binding protein